MIFKRNFSKMESASASENQDSAVEAATKVVSNEDLRTLALYGEVEESKALHTIASLIDLAESAEVHITVEEEGEEDKSATVRLPMEFIISTPGGSADDMFAIYDVMRVAREKCDLVTYGLGKVMSAGVLLLAAGTKGKRKIGKNCRVMIHSVVAGSAGSFHNLENEMSEIRYTQAAYIKALSDETNMTVPQLRKMINKKVNVYLSAEEAVDLGIADIIV